MSKRILEKILFNKATTKKVDFFKSQIFSILFPPNWRQRRKIINLHTIDFINLVKDIGILQISSYGNDNCIYDIIDTKNEVEKNGNKPTIQDISIYKSLVYALNYEEENLYQFRFEFGNKNKRIFATLTFEYESKLQVDRNYNQIIKILDTLTFTD